MTLRTVQANKELSLLQTSSSIWCGLFVPIKQTFYGRNYTVALKKNRGVLFVLLIGPEIRHGVRPLSESWQAWCIQVGTSGRSVRLSVGKSLTGINHRAIFLSDCITVQTYFIYEQL